jgi:Tfp pilus assembly protein PilO
MRRAEQATGTTGGGAPSRREIGARLAPFRGSRRTSFLGVPEVVALVAAGVLLALALAAYFLMLVPARMNVANLETERTSLQTKIRAATENRNQRQTTGETVARIVSSIERFESSALAPRETSVMKLYEELNAKTKRSGLARAQFSFVHQDDTQAGASQQSQQRAAGNLAGSARRRQDVFPAVDISLSIEGTYPNVRRFVRDLEQSPRFIVINGIQLEGVSESGGGAPGRAALVGLRLDMSGYFRRAGAPDSGADGAASR